MGAEGYYTHSRCVHQKCGVDLRDNEKVVRGNTEYSAHLFSQRVEHVLTRHDTTKVCQLTVSLL